MPQRRWTEQENAQLAAMLKEGATLVECAARLGRSYYSVQSHQFWAGMQTKFYKTWCDDERLKLEAWCMEGVPIAEMASRLGRTYGSVHLQLFRMGLRRPAVKMMRYAQLFRCQHTLQGVADAMGVKLGTAKAMKHRLKKAGHTVAPALYNNQHKHKGKARAAMLPIGV
jgi:hypothetical protein